MPNILFHIRNKIRIKAGNEIQLGSGTRVRKCQISIKGSNNTLIIEDGANLKGVQIEIDGNRCTLSIGRNSILGEGCYLSSREQGTTLSIGEECMFSRNVKIMTSDGHDILVDNSRINHAKSIHIGDRVWLADGAVILKGSEIQNDCIVGINSVVTSCFPGNTAIAGNPAKIIKSCITWKSELTY